MRAIILALHLVLLLPLSATAEVISFKPGERSASVKGELSADQTREYIFRGEAGQRFEIQASSRRQAHLTILVRDAAKKDIFSNFDSKAMKASGVLPVTGDYTVFLALRRAEALREGHLDYVLTVTVHPHDQAVALKGSGTYFVDDGAGPRVPQLVTVRLGEDHKAEINVSFGEQDGFSILGTWKEQGDEGALLVLEKAFGQAIKGHGVILLDDDRDDDGQPSTLVLYFEAPDQKTHHTLEFGPRP